MEARAPILLIDDDPAWREALSDYLRARGLHVRTAEAGEEGLDLLKKHYIPLAVIDLNMPGMSGLELLREIRRQGWNVGVLVLSSEDDPSLLRSVLAEGARAFLPKSTAPPLILEALEQALAAYDRHASEAAPPAAMNRLLPVPRRRPGRTLPVPLWLIRQTRLN